MKNSKKSVSVLQFRATILYCSETADQSTTFDTEPDAFICFHSVWPGYVFEIFLHSNQYKTITLNMWVTSKKGKKNIVKWKL